MNARRELRPKLRVIVVRQGTRLGTESFSVRRTLLLTLSLTYRCVQQGNIYHSRLKRLAQHVSASRPTPWLED